MVINCLKIWIPLRFPHKNAIIDSKMYYLSEYESSPSLSTHGTKGFLLDASLRDTTPDGKTKMQCKCTLYSATAPCCRSDSMLPGSKYAMLIKNPGPVNAHSFLKLNLYCNVKKCVRKVYQYQVRYILLALVVDG